MINRRTFLHNLFGITLVLFLSKESYAGNLTIVDELSDNGEFIIVNGWVLLKSDLDSTYDN